MIATSIFKMIFWGDMQGLIMTRIKENLATDKNSYQYRSVKENGIRNWNYTAEIVWKLLIMNGLLSHWKLRKLCSGWKKPTLNDQKNRFSLVNIHWLALILSTYSFPCLFLIYPFRMYCFAMYFKVRSELKYLNLHQLLLLLCSEFTFFLST